MQSGGKRIKGRKDWKRERETKGCGEADGEGKINKKIHT